MFLSIHGENREVVERDTCVSNEYSCEFLKSNQAKPCLYSTLHWSTASSFVVACAERLPIQSQMNLSVNNNESSI